MGTNQKVWNSGPPWPQRLVNEDIERTTIVHSQSSNTADDVFIQSYKFAQNALHRTDIIYCTGIWNKDVELCVNHSKCRTCARLARKSFANAESPRSGIRSLSIFSSAIQNFALQPMPAIGVAMVLNAFITMSTSTQEHRRACCSLLEGLWQEPMPMNLSGPSA